MALGKPDIDQLYKRALRPTLTANGHIRPFRVDLSNRNEPIDEQIYANMNASDIGVADLTYSRPSVYYEAGYLRGQAKSVIFTCRKDHLDRSQQAQHLKEILRVHFDLEQESIIPWTSPTDLTFRQRLRRRLTVVTEPLMRRLNSENAQKASERSFAELPIANRCEAIRALAKKVLARKGAYIQQGGYEVYSLSPKSRPCRALIVAVKNKYSKTDLSFYRPRRLVLSNVLLPFRTKIKEVHLVLASLEKLPISRLEDQHRRFHVYRNENTLVNLEPERADDPREVLQALGNIRSTVQFATELTRLIKFGRRSGS